MMAALDFGPPAPSVLAAWYPTLGLHTITDSTSSLLVLDCLPFGAFAHKANLVPRSFHTAA